MRILTSPHGTLTRFGQITQRTDCGFQELNHADRCRTLCETGHNTVLDAGPRIRRQLWLAGLEAHLRQPCRKLVSPDPRITGSAR